MDAAQDPDLATLPEAQQVAVDNVETLSDAGQIALFNHFNRLKMAGGQLLTAAAQPPAHLALREDLRTRLGWGHVYALQVLSDPERRSVLRQEAESRGLFLSDEVMSYMLTRFSRDLSSLMTLLDHLDQYALQTQRAITIPLIKSMLENT